MLNFLQPRISLQHWTQINELFALKQFWFPAK